MSATPLHLVLTGGTFDKRYNELNGELGFDDSHINVILEQARIDVPLTIDHLMMKDSLDMLQADREQISHACRQTKARHIVITHGTDTMAETATVVAADLSLAGKTIVLTGAMVPYSFGTRSDALFNLGTAFAFAQSLPAGVYIAMNGRHFKSGAVRKDKIAGKFVELTTATE
jgi:L-asparaginase